MLRGLGVALALAALAAGAIAQAGIEAEPPRQSGKLSPEALEELVADIAPYADPIVKQALDAACHPAALHQAALALKAGPAARGWAAQREAAWPQSVRLLRQHPELLSRLDRQLSLTTRLGIAYKAQPDDVWAAIAAVRARHPKTPQDLAAAGEPISPAP